MKNWRSLLEFCLAIGPGDRNKLERALRLAFGGLEQSGCWIWIGNRNTSGYGQAIFAGKLAVVHRIAYELFVGPIPQGLVLDHLCRNRACFRPEHLEPVTQQENNLRGVGAAAQAARKHRCSNGHPLSGNNLLDTSRYAPSRRRCRACVISSSRRQRMRLQKLRRARGG